MPRTFETITNGGCREDNVCGNLSMFAMMGMLSQEWPKRPKSSLAGQGVVSAVRDVAPAFERSGNKVVVSFEVGPGLMNKVNSDAPADVVTHYPDMIDDLTKKGKCSQVLVLSRWHRVAVRAGAPIPTSARAFAFNARCQSVAYSRAGATAGIADEMKSRPAGGRAGREVVPKAKPKSGCSRSSFCFAGIHYVGRCRQLRLRRFRPGFGSCAGGGDCDGQVHVRTGSCATH